VTGELSVSNGSNLNCIGRSYCYGWTSQ
jgi:hypothetical protein